MGWIATILSALVSGLVKGFFNRKKEKKATDILIEERDDVIEKGTKANKIRSRLLSDPPYSNGVRTKYTREDE